MEYKYIVLDYYEGAYGPTVRIDVHSIDHLRKLKDLFLWLSEAAERKVNLPELDYINALGVSKLILKSTSGRQVHKKRFVRDTSTMSGAAGEVFHWAMPSDDWLDAADLVDRLIEVNRPGHQYLTQEGLDDAIVELAYME